MISAEFHVHQAGHRLVTLRVPIIGKALHEGRGTIADADDPHADLA
jgi:hypothetical protein